MMPHLKEKISDEGWCLFDKISRRAIKPIMQYHMIEEGDHILVGVSGGKDSLTLLNVLLHRQCIAPIHFNITAVHIDAGLPTANWRDLEIYFKEINVAYHIEHQDLSLGGDFSKLNCFWCSWNRRKALFEFATKNGFNKIALGHHLDDVVETMLMNQVFRGELSTMCPKQTLFNGRLSIIRPLAYEKESMIAHFARLSGLDRFQICSCPIEKGTRRQMIKQMIKELEKITPSVKMNLFKSLNNIKADYIPHKDEDFLLDEK